MSPFEKLSRLRELFKRLDEIEAEIILLIGPEPSEETIREKKVSLLKSIKEHKEEKVEPAETKEDKPAGGGKKRGRPKGSKSDKPFVVNVKYRCQDCNETYKVGIGEAATCPFCESDNYEII